MCPLNCQSLTLINAGLSNISDGSSLNDVPDDKLLDGLILGNTASTVGASHWLDMSTPVLVASSVPSLERLKDRKNNVIVITDGVPLESHKNMIQTSVTTDYTMATIYHVMGL